MQIKRIMGILQRLIRDKKYRNLVIKRLRQETEKAVRPVNIATRLPDEDQKFLKTLNLGFVGGCELSFMKEFLEVNGATCYLTFDHGESSDPFLALNEKNCGIFSFAPDIMIISDVQQIRNNIYDIQSGKISFNEQEEQLLNAKDKVRNGINSAREKLSAVYVIMTYPLVKRPAYGRFDYAQLEKSFSLTEFLKRLDLYYYELSKQEEDVYVLSVDDAFLNAGLGYKIREEDADGVYEHLSREGAITVAQELLHHLKVIKGHGRRVKCAVIDLDNTLWDGTLRDDGIEGVHFYKNRLRVLELLTKRGIILAIASKNDSSLEAIIDKILGQAATLFTVKKINWNDKAQSLLEIAQELNIGIDSLAFFDDNPYERDQVKTFLPQVLVLPDTEILHSLNRIEFEPIGKITKESSRRAELYGEQKQRELAEKRFMDKESFLRSCNMEVWMREAKPENLGRITELIQRTNQLNATAVRYSKEEILQFHHSVDYRIYIINLYDRYGDYGLIGVCLSHKMNGKWVMEVLTFSCRAMGKTLEQTFLLYLLREAKKENITTLVGKYHRTDRNEAIERVFLDSNFEKTASKDDLVIWEYDISKKDVPSYPDWFTILKRAKK